MTASNIHYESADRVRGLGAGGIGALFLLAQRIELWRRGQRRFLVPSRKVTRNLV